MPLLVSPARERWVLGRVTLKGYSDYNKRGPLQVLAVLLGVLALTGCGGSDEATMVWCVGPDEEVTEAFKAEYPDLYMTKAECDVWKGAFEDG